MKYKWWVVISLVALLLMVWRSIGDSKVKVVFCDVGQGDGALIISGSFQMLIDTGGNNQRMLSCLSRHLPFWDKNIETVVLSHWDIDHSGGLPDISRYYKIEKLYSNRLPPAGDEQKFYPTIIGENDIIRYGGIDFEILSKNVDDGDSNENSLVGVLRYKDLPSGRQVKILMMGDAPMEVEQSLVWQEKLKSLSNEVDILKISHHGSDMATSEELLDEVNPKEAVISVGKNNKFGHPGKVVLKRLEERGIKIKRTDNMGDVTVTY
ncbi:MBL fold metallo-hydrolase [Candidatus Shapirobacteria bacterium]|nr:MBL fold metallo-hydrolase [Candidatus Shapirobacteria bacterium]